MPLADGGNQQYTVRSFEISGQTTSCICLLWDWGWTWSGMTLAASPVGITLINPEDPNGQQAGSIYVMDTLFDGIDTVVHSTFMKETILKTSIITLDNVGVLNVNYMVTFPNGVYLDIPVATVDHIVIGNIQNEEGGIYGAYGCVSPLLSLQTMQPLHHPC